MNKDTLLQDLLESLIRHYGVESVLTQLHYAMMSIPSKDYNSTAQDVWKTKERHKARECSKCGGDSSPGHYCM